MNRVCLVGRLTRKPELRENESGVKQTTFTLAVNRMKEGADFINCVAWRKIAETIEKYLDKGDQLGIEGRIQVSTYQDKEGNNKYSTNVVVDNITFIGSKKEEKEEKKEEVDPFKDFSEEVELSDADLPF